MEHEQQGEKRAEYGKYVIKGLSEYLTENIGKGYSIENLKLMRKFFLAYSENQIGESVITQFKAENQISQSVITKSDDDSISESLIRKFKKDEPIGESVIT
ncbi:MAG: DUF1016 N-terminal domain-containing protein [Prevotellaceae bacterium]|nr:DUF1016 N-terminal domain-containing protein [Prevotellaceae bacterium]